MAHGAVPHVRPVHGRQGARVSGCDVLPHGPRKASQQAARGARSKRYHTGGKNEEKKIFTMYE